MKLIKTLVYLILKIMIYLLGPLSIGFGVAVVIFSLIAGFKIGMEVVQKLFGAF